MIGEDNRPDGRCPAQDAQIATGAKTVFGKWLQPNTKRKN